MTEKQPQIFLSYAWANVNVADAIDNDFKAVGITFQRDVRDVNYTGSIKDFMNKIGKSDFVVMLISDEYIKSENCMYEVTELMNAHEFEKRILPVIVNNAPVFKRDDHRVYYDYWQNELKKVNQLLVDFTNEKTLEDKKKIQSINDYLGAFFQKITDLKSEHFEVLKTKNYKPMIDKIGFDEKHVLAQVIKLKEIKDREEQELALEEFLKLHPNNRYVLFQRASYANNSSEYKKAKKYYEDLLKNYPRDAYAYSNLANILQNHFSDFDGAKKNYEKAISINPHLADVHYNLAILLEKGFRNYIEAMIHYEIAIALNPKAIYHNNIAVLSQEHFNDIQKAKKNYEEAIKINPRHISAHYNLAVLLQSHFSDYITAKKHFEIVLELDPKDTDAHYNLAVLLRNYFGDFEGAKKHYELAIAINPNDLQSLNNLASLLKNEFSDYDNAKKYFERAHDVDPNSELVKTNLSELIKEHFS